MLVWTISPLKGSDKIKLLFPNYFHFNLSHKRSEFCIIPIWGHKDLWCQLFPFPTRPMWWIRTCTVSFVVLSEWSFNLSLFVLLSTMMNYSPRNQKIEFHYLLIRRICVCVYIYINGQVQLRILSHFRENNFKDRSVREKRKVFQ